MNKMYEELKVPYIDKRIVEYLKGVYNLRDTLNMTVNEEANLQVGFMYGVQHVIDRLDAIVKRQEGD